MMKVDEIAGLSLTPGMEPTPYSARFPSERNLPTLPPSGARLAVQSQPTKCLSESFSVLCVPIYSGGSYWIPGSWM